MIHRADQPIRESPGHRKARAKLADARRLVESAADRIKLLRIELNQALYRWRAECRDLGRAEKAYRAVIESETDAWEGLPDA